MVTPKYIEAFENGVLKENTGIAYEKLRNCSLCPHACMVDRLSGETGICKTAEYAYVSSYGPHFGEESVLVGSRGSGTIFFTHCNLLCNFCQNFDISHHGKGKMVNATQLANIMLELQDYGCHNINFVTPSHVIPQIFSAIAIAIPKGLRLPLVYNTGAYDSIESLKLLESIIDIYMPDLKFLDKALAETTCEAPDYPEIAKNAISEMHQQVGELKIENSIATRGLMIRHLVMPNHIEDSKACLRFIAKEISCNTYVNIMPQYRPYYHALDSKKLNRPINRKEFEEVLDYAGEIGLWRLAD